MAESGGCEHEERGELWESRGARYCGGLTLQLNATVLSSHSLLAYRYKLSSHRSTLGVIVLDGMQYLTKSCSFIWRSMSQKVTSSQLAAPSICLQPLLLALWGKRLIQPQPSNQLPPQLYLSALKLLLLRSAALRLHLLGLGISQMCHSLQRFPTLNTRHRLKRLGCKSSR